MARQGSWSTHCNAPFSGKICDPRSLPCRPLDLHIITKSKRSIRAIESIPTSMSFLIVVRVSSIIYFRRQMPTSTHSSNAALGCWPSRFVLAAMYHFPSGLFDSRSLIRVTQWSIRRSHWSGPAPCSLMMLMEWAISQTRSRTVISIHCVVKPPSSCQIPIVSDAQWLTPTPAFST